MGKDVSGIKNEKDILQYLNSKERFEEYNDNIKRFLKALFPSIIDGNYVTCERLKGVKPDLCIKHNGVSKYVSVKIGCGNSVHQEDVETFLGFLGERKISEEIRNNVKLFHYGDDTIAGNGKVRYTAKECNKRYLDEIKCINSELNHKDIIEPILNRLLFEGNSCKKIMVDYIYHGNIDEGIWASKEEIIEYFKKNMFDGGTIHFGTLTYQVWGRDPYRKAKYPKRRNTMQVKWAQIKTDINEIVKERKI